MQRRAAREMWLSTDEFAADFAWSAPSEVTNALLRNYRETLGWAESAGRFSGVHGWQRDAERFMTRPFLARFHDEAENNTFPRLGVAIRTEHHPFVFGFSEPGTCGLLVDIQRNRRAALYDPATQSRIATEDLGNAMLVYMMLFSSHDQRWKLHHRIQETMVTHYVPERLETWLLQNAPRSRQILAVN
jgi:hypothetical protein